MRTNIGRRLQILDCILRHEAQGRGGLAVVAVSDQLGREKSQISRGLAALASCGLVDREDSREFIVGARLLELAARAGRPALLRQARRVCRQIAADLGERVQLNVIVRDRVLTVETFASVAAVQAAAWVGMTNPLHCTAGGRALLFDDDDEALRARLGADPFPEGLPPAPRTLAELRSRLSEEREGGVATASGELEDDLASIAAPIRDRSGQIIAALTVAGPRSRLELVLGQAGRATLEAVAVISNRVEPEIETNR